MVFPPFPPVIPATHVVSTSVSQQNEGRTQKERWGAVSVSAMKSEELQILPEHLAAEEQCTKNKASQGSTRLESRKGAEVEAKLSEAAWMLKQESRRVFSELMSLKKRKQQFEEGQVAAARAITQKANIVYQMLRKVHANFQRVFSEMAPGLVGLGDVLGEHIDMSIAAQAVHSSTFQEPEDSGGLELGVCHPKAFAWSLLLAGRNRHSTGRLLPYGAGPQRRSHRHGV
ncbi:smc3 [Symbiodinium sp. CCMP2592]|nr:smc3 [Symbiodinium sp. CCMP2592]